MQVRFKRLSESAKMPTYATEGSCGADLYASEDRTLLPGETARIDTGIAVELPYSCVGFVLPRSSMALKQVPAEVGTIDRDYRGVISVTLTNHSRGFFQVKSGDRIGQLLILPCVRVDFVEADELSETQRGAGGYGSSGR